MVKMEDVLVVEMKPEELEVLLAVVVVVQLVLRNVEFVRCKNQLLNPKISSRKIFQINLPVGTGFHDISKFPIPALCNCTFSGSPGHAVSKHHKSLQQTY